MILGQHMNKTIIASLLLVTVSGCTSLKSTRLADSGDSTPQGLTYRLPAKKFTVTANLEVTGCTATKQSISLDATVSSTLTESLIGGEAYTINYQDLNTWTKITDTEFQLSEAGLLTGVNASIIDRSAAVLTNSASAIASVTRANVLPQISAPLDRDYLESLNSFIVPDFDVGSPIPEFQNIGPLQTISPTTYFQLKSLEDQKLVDNEMKSNLTNVISEYVSPCKKTNDLITSKKSAELKLKKEKDNEKKRAAAQSNIDEANLLIASLKTLVEYYEKLENQQERDSLTKRIALIEKEKLEVQARLESLGESKIDELTKQIANATAKLTISDSSDFIPTNSNTCTEDNDVVSTCQVVIKQEHLKKLFENTVDLSQVELPVVGFVAKPLEVIPQKESKHPEKDKIGIAYRIPVAATSKVAYRAKMDEKVTTLLIENVTQIPQFGPIGSLNLNNKAFDDNLIEVAFNATTGAPSKLTFKAKSKAESASGAANDIASTYLQLNKDRQSDSIAANKAILEQANSQIALEKSKSDLELSKVESSVSIAKAQADLQQSLVSTQLELLRDQQRLDAVRTGTATTAEVELEALSTQEKILSQQLKILKLQQEIAEQKAMLSAGSTP